MRWMTEGKSASMQDLTPVGLSKDGTRLVLVNSSGEEFAVAVDHRLRTALRGDNARLGQLEMKMESALRPRDIQTRIRNGESPEDVAAAAQSTVEAIWPFAAPVLAERAHVAELAQGSSVRRRQGGEAPAGPRTLGETAAAYFTALGARVDDVDWDAWRRDDGRWALVANFGSGAAPQQAQFSFDQRGRYVVAENDEARMLTGELARPEKKAARPGTTRRLSAVPADDQLPLGDDDLGADALELVREPAPAGADEEETADLGDAAAAVRAQADAGAAADEEAQDTAQDTTQETAQETAQETDRDTGQESGAPTAQDSGQDSEQDSEQDAGQDSGQDRPAAPAPDKPAGRKSRRKGRSSVPSWDEIMFGGGDKGQ